MPGNLLNQWLIFTKRDRIAAIILLSAISITIVLPYFFKAQKTEIHIDTALQAELDKYLLTNAGQKDRTYIAAVDTTITDTTKKELFYFDPNTLSEEGFVQLGLPPKTAHTIINYRNKGGYFKNAEDIRKIYSLSKSDADRIIAWIRMEKTKAPTQNSYKEAVPGPSKQYKKLNINTATAEEWKTFPGIGDAIANRIVKFRTSIGGFKTVEQVGKTYGLTDSVYQAIRPYLYLSDSTNTAGKK